MAEGARRYACAIRIVLLNRVSFVIEGDGAPLVIEAVLIERDFLRLFFALFRDLILS